MAGKNRTQIPGTGQKSRNWRPRERRWVEGTKICEVFADTQGGGLGFGAGAPPCTTCRPNDAYLSTSRHIDTHLTDRRGGAPGGTPSRFRRFDKADLLSSPILPNPSSDSTWIERRMLTSALTTARPADFGSRRSWHGLSVNFQLIIVKHWTSNPVWPGELG